MPQHLLRLLFAAMITTCCTQTLAIEAPKKETPAAAAIPESAAPTADDKAFYETLRRATQHRNMSGLKIPESVVLQLARGAADEAVAALSGAAAKGGNQENIALVRIQHWCTSMANSPTNNVQAQIDKLDANLPVERRSRAAGVLREQARFREVAAASCGRAQFDYGGIEARLRSAADAGDPASATELAKFLQDPARKLALLKAAAAKDFPPAMYALATARLIAVQRNENTQDVASIRTMYKQAGRFLSKAKLELANCMALGCDGYPADAAAATSFGLDAARDGEPIAFISMIRMGWGARLTRAQLLAWQYFGDRLNEAGCMGEVYITNSIAFHQTIQALEQGQDQKLPTDARQLADEYWRENGTRAQKEQGCLPQ